MTKINHNIVINAPIEAVFGYVSDPRNIKQTWPNVKKIIELWELPNGGYGTKWEYNLGGVSIEGTTEAIEWKENQRIMLASQGEKGLEAVTTISFEKNSNATSMSYEVEYTLPYPFWGGVLAEILRRKKDSEAEWILKNLKADIERLDTQSS